MGKMVHSFGQAFLQRPSQYLACFLKQNFITSSHQAKVLGTFVRCRYSLRLAVFFFRAVWWDRFSDNSRQIHVSVCSLIVRYWLTDRHHLLPGILEVVHTLKGLPHFVQLNGHKPQGAFSLVKESLEGCPSTDKNEIHHIPVTWSEIHSPAQTAQ